MLFDLRSRGRRHTVRVVYLFLALLMLGGLVLVGVGTGNNNGGLLNAFTNSGSGSGQNAAVSQATAAAAKAIKKHPNSADAWASMLQARWQAATTGSNFDSNTGAFSAGGEHQLRLAADAWQKYLKLNSGKPALLNANTAAQAYQALARWGDASNAWQDVIAVTPAGATSTLKGYLCMALTSYAAGYVSKGDLASAAAMRLAPKAEKTQFKSTLSSAKSSTKTAAQSAVSSC